MRREALSIACTQCGVWVANLSVPTSRRVSSSPRRSMALALLRAWEGSAALGLRPSGEATMKRLVWFLLARSAYRTRMARAACVD